MKRSMKQKKELPPPAQYALYDLYMRVSHIRLFYFLFILQQRKPYSYQKKKKRIQPRFDSVSHYAQNLLYGMKGEQLITES